jgi:predicted nucleic acid-binding protein
VDDAAMVAIRRRYEVLRHRSSAPLSYHWSGGGPVEVGDPPAESNKDASCGVAYLNNEIVSAIGKDDTPSERTALLQILDMDEKGALKLVTSKVTANEIARYKGQYKWDLDEVYERLKKVRFVEDYRLLGFYSEWGPSGGFSQPLLEDHPMSAKLHQIGLDQMDAHHLMLAILAECDVFLTCDERGPRGILRHRAEIEREFPIRLLKPSELMEGFDG